MSDKHVAPVRGRGRPPKVSKATFGVETANGTLNVTISGAENSDAQTEMVSTLASKIRAHVSKNVKGFKPEAVTVKA